MGRQMSKLKFRVVVPPGGIEGNGCPEGVMAWRGGWDQRVLASVGYQVCLEQKLIYLEYATARTGQRRYPAQLTASDLPWSGKRWWFRCPILNGDGACGRRVSKLYLPPGQICFGCRACHRPPEFDIDPNSRNNGVSATIVPGQGGDFTNTKSPTLTVDSKGFL